MINSVVKKVDGWKNRFTKLRNRFIEKEFELYREKYMLKNKCYPNETEEKYFKRNLIARLGIIIYFSVAIIGFVLITLLKGIG
ncbi:hypothetical protein G3M81_23105 [Bacillus paralicheniformis]|uniref:hypothetical protein n=1 Tax=Bacillus TaxID=1386 RepID=UPI0013EE5BE9|nr:MULTISPECIES: hypothetical protein [Bacillus]QII26981.1 hypothetical protein G3M80_21015 [Bacillus altitudinis]QII51449.1 hypothetical protein G3M81_23105 [Bacillus paralicheniformis]